LLNLVATDVISGSGTGHPRPVCSNAGAILVSAAVSCTGISQLPLCTSHSFVPHR